MSGLIKNEIIKTYKSGFIKAALCVILAICIIVPVGCWILNKEEVSYFDNYYGEQAENAENPIEKAYCQAYADVDKFFADNKIGYGDWRYDYYYGNVCTLNISKAVCKLACEGYSAEETEEWFLYEERNLSLNFDKRHNVVLSEEDYKDAFEMSKDELNKADKNIEKMLTELRDYILKASITDSYEESIEINNENISAAELSLKEAEAELKKNPENAKLIYARDTAKAELDSEKLNLWGAEYLLKNKSEYNSWQYIAVNDTLMSISSEYSTVPMNEEMFRGSDERHFYRDYETYLKGINNRRNKAKNTEKLVKYALEKNIPIPECMEDSAKTNFDSDLRFAATLVGILMVAVASTTLFSEYSTGSIRLLLIRPKSRSKILLSKLITVIIYGAAAMAASAVILFILDMLIHGDKDITVPYLMVGSDGNVKEIAPLVYTLIRVFAKLFSTFAIVSAAFLVSAVFTKGGILALAIGSASMCMTSVVPSLAEAFNNDVKGAFAYTIFPYIDMSKYYSNPVGAFSSYGTSITEELFGSSSLSDEFSAKVGVIMIALHIAVFLGLAFYGFRKKQIKN